MVEAGHLVGRRAIEILAVEAVLPSRRREDVAAAGRAVDGREAALPDGHLVRQRVVAVPRQDDGVRVLREEQALLLAAAGLAVVPLRAAEEPRRVDRVVDRFVLHVEERLPAVPQRRAVLRHERGRDLGFRVDVPVEVLERTAEPLAEDEHVTLHRLHADLFVVLAPQPLPGGLAVVVEGLRAQGLLVAEALPVPVHLVVVAGDEEALDLRAVGTPVVGEHVEPGPRHVLELLDRARREEVAREQHGVHLLVAQDLETAVEAAHRNGVVAVHVAHDAHAQVRRARGRSHGLQTRSRGGQRGRPYEFASRHDSVLQIRIFMPAFQ